MERIMRSIWYVLIWYQILLSVAAATFLLASANFLFAAVQSESTSERIPPYVQAGVPFTIRDRYATQVCISSSPGQPVPPFVIPSNAHSRFAPFAPSVQTWVPFIVHDAHGAQICISSRGGQVYLPLVIP
jgi:hypothetical protein